jgi:hypothetical protein
VLLATGRYLGEGSTMLDLIRSFLRADFVARRSHDAGRLHRLHPTKRDVMIYDYVDGREPMPSHELAAQV